MKPLRFRNKPVEIVAMRWNGTDSGAIGVVDWIASEGGAAVYVVHAEDPPAIHVETLDAVARAFAGDWIIQGTVGEFYPCRSDVFYAKYSPVYDELSDEAIHRLMTDVYDDKDGD